MLFNWDEWNYDYSYYYGRADINLSSSLETTVLPFAVFESNFDTEYEVEKSMLRSGLDISLSRGDYYLSTFWFNEGMVLMRIQVLQVSGLKTT